MNPTESELLKTSEKDDGDSMIIASDSEDTVRGPMTKCTKLSQQSPTGKSSTSSWSEMADMSENIQSKRGAQKVQASHA
jgi:hypothetical protein